MGHRNRVVEIGTAQSDAVAVQNIQPIIIALEDGKVGGAAADIHDQPRLPNPTKSTTGPSGGFGFEHKLNVGKARRVIAGPQVILGLLIALSIGRVEPDGTPRQNARAGLTDLRLGTGFHLD